MTMADTSLHGALRKLRAELIEAAEGAAIRATVVRIVAAHELRAEWERKHADSPPANWTGTRDQWATRLQFPLCIDTDGLGLEVARVQRGLSPAEFIAWLHTVASMHELSCSPAVLGSVDVRRRVEEALRAAMDAWGGRAIEPTGAVGPAVRSELKDRQDMASAKAALGRKKDVSRAQLEAEREKFINKHGRERGWKAAAMAEFGISGDLLNRRMRELGRD